VHQHDDAIPNTTNKDNDLKSRIKPLTPMEFQLLRYFQEHRGTTLSRDELLREVWGYKGLPTTLTVDVHVAWLRQKIERDPKNPQLLLTVGSGYKFVG
jgi:DNA-binding response OmpR family regulator